MVDMARVRTVWTGVEGSPYYSNLYFLNVEDSSDAQTVIDLVAAYMDDLSDTWDNNLSAFTEPDVAIIDSVSGEIQQIFTGTGATSVGAVAGDILPASSQLLIRMLTDSYVGGRRIRGRMFVPSQAEANSTVGKPTGALTAGVAVFAEDLRAAAAAAIHGWVVWSRKNGTAPPVTAVSVWDQWAVLRSRRD
jgi:hypothetical protein